MTASDEPPIREFADRGVLWLLESPQNLADLLHLLAAELAARLDFTRAERRNRSFVPPNLHKQETDLLYRVPFVEPGGQAREVLIYLLAEHQSEPDEEMGLRFLSYLVQVWEAERREWQQKRIAKGERRLHPIVPILLYTGTRRWERVPSVADMMDLPTLCARFQPWHETLFLEPVRNPDGDAAKFSGGLGIARVAECGGSTGDAAEVLASAVQYLEGLPEEAQAEWRRAMQFLLLLILHKREPREQAGLRDVVIRSAKRKHRAEVRDMAMTGAQALEEKGRREGQQLLLLAQLEQKFGSLPASIINKVQAMTEPQLREIGLQILTVQSLKELGL